MMRNFIPKECTAVMSIELKIQIIFKYLELIAHQKILQESHPT